MHYCLRHEIFPVARANMGREKSSYTPYSDLPCPHK